MRVKHLIKGLFILFLIHTFILAVVGYFPEWDESISTFIDFYMILGLASWFIVISAGVMKLIIDVWNKKLF